MTRLPIFCAHVPSFHHAFMESIERFDLSLRRTVRLPVRVQIPGTERENGYPGPSPGASITLVRSLPSAYALSWPSSSHFVAMLAACGRRPPEKPDSRLHRSAVYWADPPGRPLSAGCVEERLSTCAMAPAVAAPLSLVQAVSKIRAPAPDWAVSHRARHEWLFRLALSQMQGAV